MLWFFVFLFHEDLQKEPDKYIKYFQYEELLEIRYLSLFLLPVRIVTISLIFRMFS